MIESFTGLYDFLSNFYIKPIVWDSIRYISVENAYQATKTLDISVRESFANLSPRDAKSKGRHILLRPEWEEMKIAVMATLLRIKFSDPEMKRLLLLTKEERLIEGNWWHDCFWGASCTCSKCFDKKKENTLGKLLMEIREELKNGMVYV